jgi:hypothetical protein
MATTQTVTITGLEEVLRKLAALGGNVRLAAAQALYEEARAIQAESQARYVPVDTGELRRDHAFIDESAKIEGDTVSVTLGYSGPYAASVHENPRAGKTGGVSPSGQKYRHWASTGQFKFLEIPVLNATQGMLGRLAGRIRSGMGGR